MFGCFTGCLNKSKKQKNRHQIQNKQNSSNKKQIKEQQKQSDSKNTNFLPLDSLQVISALQFELETRERQESFGKYQSEVISYLKQTNPVFQKKRPFKFPSPFIKYKVIPYLHEKQAMDLATTNDPGNAFNKHTMIRYSYHGGPNQLFYFKEKQPNLFYIISVSKGFTVSVPDGRTQNGVQIVGNPRNDVQNQLWEMVQGNISNTFMLKSFSGKYMTVTEGLLQSIKITQEQFTDKKSQLWIITPS